MSDDVRRTDSGIEIRSLYTEGDLDGWDAAERLGLPGEAPFTRGVYPSMYRGRLWTMRQYSGFGDAASTNQRFRFLLEAGQTGLSCAFDLPTQMGYDSDHPRAEGEVGKVGVAIDSIDDMRTLLAGIPLDTVTTSMTINSTAAILLLMYEIVAEEQGVASDRISGTIQNDLLKEYIARGTYVYPPKPSMRIITDIFGYCSENIPRWNTISISGYHIREAGSTAVQEIAFTIANAIAYVQAAIDAGLDVDDFAPRLSFFWNGHNHFFEEVAKFRAARRLWATICRERFGIEDDKATQLRFHTQTGGSTLTAQEPANNVVRVTVQALAAVLGGTQSLHTNSSDEALSLPSQEAAQVALRTQQILARESGVTEVADPLGGSPYVEALTDAVEEGARALLSEIDTRGGTVAAIADGFIRRRIESSAFKAQIAIDSGEATPVGVSEDAEIPEAPFRVDPAVERERRDAMARFRAERDETVVTAARGEIARVAASGENVLPALIAAVESRVTLGEIAETLALEFGEYRDDA